MKCEKISFDTIDSANRRANEINNQNKKNKDKTTLRPYTCKECGKAHLSSMTKKAHKWATSEESRKSTRKKVSDKKMGFRIQKEADYWEDRLG